MTKLELQCGSCGGMLQVDASQAGTTAACPTCAALIDVSLLAEVVEEPPRQALVNPYANSSPSITTDPFPNLQQSYPPPRSSDPALRMIIPIDRSIWAIAAGYLGLFSLICFPAPIALIVGIIAVRDINQSGGKKHGLGRAWFGIVMGTLFTLILVGAIVAGILSS